MSDTRIASNDELTANGDRQWKWLTVMEQPQTADDPQIIFGRETTIKDINNTVRKKPIEYVPLPKTMTREEIKNWLSDGWGEQIIKNATS